MSRRRRSRRVAGQRPEPASVALLTWTRRIGLGLIVAEILLVPVVFDRTALQAFVLPKALIARSIGLLLLGVLMAHVALGGWADVRRSRLHLPVLAFALAYSLATLFALDVPLALVGAPERQLGFLTIASYVVLYFAAATFVRSPRDLALVGGAALAASLVAAGYAFVQWLGLDPLSWASDETVRTFSTTGNATSLGHLLSTLAVVAAAGAILAPLPRLARLTLAVAGFTLILGAATTGSRAVILGVIAGGAVLSIFVWLGQRGFRRRSALAVGAVAAAAALAAVVVNSPVGDRFMTFASSLDPRAGPAVISRDPSVDGRAVLYDVAAKAVAERPVLGLGPDNYVVRFPAHRPERASYILLTTAPETSPHSWVLKVATDAGLLAVAVYLAILVVAVVTVARAGRPWPASAALATLVAFLATGTVTITDVSTEWIPWLALGVIASAPAHAADRGPAAGAPRRQTAPRIGVAIVSLGLASALALWSLPLWEASRAAESARRTRVQGGDPALAISFSERALALDAGHAAHWHGLALSLSGARRYADAIPAYERAIALSPWDVRYRGNLARAHLLLALGGSAPDRERALAAADAAVRADPNNPLGHHTRSLVLRALGRQQDALIALERAFALGPDSVVDEATLDNAARVYLVAGRGVDAVRLARRGIAEANKAGNLIARDLRLVLIQAHVLTNNLPFALSEADFLIKADPQDAEAQRYRGIILQRMRG